MIPTTSSRHVSSQIFLGLLAVAIVLGITWSSDAQAPSYQGQIEGVTEPAREIHVAAAEAGMISRIHVTEGDRVKAGDLLVDLDLDVLQATLEIAKSPAKSSGRMEAAVAELNLAEDRQRKMQELRQSGFAQEAELKRAEADVAIAQASLTTAREDQKISQLELGRIQAQINRRRMRSPVHGVVTRIHKEEAEFVNPSQDEVVTVVQLNPLRVVFAVPARMAAKLKQGQPANIKFLANNQVAQAKVEFISPVNDAQTGTVRVKMLIDNSSGRYRSGVRARLVLDTTDDSRRSDDGRAGDATSRPTAIPSLRTPRVN